MQNLQIQNLHIKSFRGSQNQKCTLRHNSTHSFEHTQRSWRNYQLRTNFSTLHPWRFVTISSVSVKQFKVLQAVEYKLCKWRRHVCSGSKGCQNTSLQQLSIHATSCTSAWKFSCSYNAPPTPPSSMPLYCKIRRSPFSHPSSLERSIICTAYGHAKSLGRKALHFCIW